MFKKFSMVIILLFFLFSAFLLTGCFDNGKDDDKKKQDEVTNQDEIINQNEVTNQKALSGINGNVTLTWSNPADSDFDHVVITWTPDGSERIVVNSGEELFLIEGLSHGTVYTFTLKTVDYLDNISSGITVTATPDASPPSEVTELTGSPEPDGKVMITWKDPVEGDFDHIKISWGMDQIRTVYKGIEEYTIEGLTHGTEYTFTIKTVDSTGNISNGISSDTVTSDSLSPKNVTTTNIIRGNDNITINWADPSDDDFNHVEITWEPEGSTPLIVNAGVKSFKATNLQEETFYTFTIKSVDTAGNKSSGEIVVALTTAESDPPITEIVALPIYSADDLNAVRGGITGYEDWDLTNDYVLMNDIDLSAFKIGEGWIPVGDETTPFTGTFNGNGYTVSNLFINRPHETTGENQGLFGFINNATIENLTISNVDITVYSGAGLIGINNEGIISNCSVSGKFTAKEDGGLASGLVGINDGGTIEKCSVSGILTGEGEGTIVSGLVGVNDGGSVKNCFSTATITAEINGSYAGSLMGINYSSIENCNASGTVNGFYAGGLVALNNGGTIKNCYTTTTVNSTGDWTSAGGLAGAVWGGGGTIINCYTTGNITATGETSYAGGLVGYYSNAVIVNSYATGNSNAEGDVECAAGGGVGINAGGSIENSYATGNSSSTGAGICAAGGFVGINKGGIENNYATGNVTTDGESSTAGGLAGYNSSTIEYSYAVGAVVALGSSSVSGGLVGENDGGTITSGLYDTTISGQIDTGKGVPLPTGDMKVQENYTGWDFVNESGNGTNDIWILDELINNGYPYQKENPSLLYSGSGSGTQYKLIVLVSGNGGVDPAPGYHMYDDSESVTLTPSPYAGYYFSNWEGDAAGSENPITLDIDNDKSVTAVFKKIISISTEPGASVSGEPVTGHPSVIVVNSEGVPVQGVTVTVAEKNGKTFTGTVTQNTDSSGIAIFDDLIFLEGEYTFIFSAVSYGIIESAQFTVGLVGEGTEASPYLVHNLFGIEQINNNVTAWFRLENDIDASITSTPGSDYYDDGEGWVPVCRSDSSVFTGTFDGNGNIVSNLYINRNSSYKGLFGIIGEGGTVKNLAIEDANMSGQYDLGTLVGENRGTIDYCYATGNVTGGSYVHAGGLVGQNTHTGIIKNSYAVVNVTTEGKNTGGLVGSNDGLIEKCFATGNVAGSGDWSHAGGLVGLHWNQVGGTAIIRNCYATGNVTTVLETDQHAYTGSLVGYTRDIVEKSYGKGLVTNTVDPGDTWGLIGGEVIGPVTDCYHDSETTGWSDTHTGSQPRTTNQMKLDDTSVDTYLNWDFVGEDVNGTEYVWNIDKDSSDGLINDGYPYLENNPPPEL